MKRFPKKLLPLFIFAFLGLVLVLLMLTGTFRVYHVPVRSMSPTLIPGDYIFVTRSFRSHNDLQRGDLVVFTPPVSPDHSWVKRIAALPGDRIELLAGHLTVNGTLLQSPEGLHSKPAELPPHRLPRRWKRISYPLIVPKGHVFLMGDNYANSLDSRYFGTVPIDSITHLPRCIVLPPGRFGSLH